MKEIVKVNLENEMDLILANKRAMKLAELCGLSVTVQTAVATAVSEIARCALAAGRKSSLTLSIKNVSPTKKQIAALVSNTTEDIATLEAISSAKRLVNDLQSIRKPIGYEVQLNQDIKFAGLITDTKIESFIE